MIKRIMAVLTVLLMVGMMAAPAFAASKPLVVDKADLLTDLEEQQLSAKLQAIQRDQNFDAVILTVDDLDGQSAMSFADDYFDYQGYGQGAEQDGCLLLLDMEDREWYLSTSGFGIDAITDAGRDYMSEQFLPYLRNGDYYNGFDQYTNLVNEFVVQAKTGQPYDTGNLPKGDPPIAMGLGAGGIFGLIAAKLKMGRDKSQLKSKHHKTGAREYISHNPGAITVDEATDMFLFTNVTRVRIETPKAVGGGGGSTVHTSSSGHTHGGGGGHF